MMKFRTDLFYSLIAFEAILVAIAAILWFPTWILAVAIAAIIFSLAEMIVNIARMKKASYNEESGKSDYKFPIGLFAIYAVMLIALTAAVILGIKMLFGFLLIALAALFITLLVFALIYKLKVLKVIAAILVAALVIFLVGYGAAHLVHSGIDLNPGVVTEEDTAPEQDKAPEKDTSTEQDTTPEEDTTPEQDTTPEEDTTPEQDTTPEVTPKITAPETMKYGEPVTVTLEAIEADNLKYGNSDFISIVKVSDTQVVLTLVGIVNDEGQVEIVPASGYITITDSASGTNVSIRIVE